MDNEVEYKVIIQHPEACKSPAVQRQLAAWLVAFGIKHGTIPIPEKEVNHLEQKAKVLHMRCRSEQKELCAVRG